MFFSFHYKPDNWRASQVRNMGVIEGNAAISDNDWEEVTKGGDKAIEKWIADQMHGRSCTVVLIGTNTAGRKWIKHEIKKTWEDKKGLVGVYIHGLKNAHQEQSTKGSNPFSGITVVDKDDNKLSLDKIIKTYDPPYKMSTNVYEHIEKNLEDWVEEAIKIREKY